MIQTIGFCQFTDNFNDMRPNSFSYHGLRALYDWFEQYEDDTGEPVELDVIAICCAFTEFEDMQEYWDTYGKQCQTLDDIAEHTIVIPVWGDSFIIQDY